MLAGEISVTILCELVKKLIEIRGTMITKKVRNRDHEMDKQLLLRRVRAERLGRRKHVVNLLSSDALDSDIVVQL